MPAVTEMTVLSWLLTKNGSMTNEDHHQAENALGTDGFFCPCQKAW